MVKFAHQGKVAILVENRPAPKGCLAATRGAGLSEVPDRRKRHGKRRAGPAGRPPGKGAALDQTRIDAASREIPDAGERDAAAQHGIPSRRPTPSGKINEQGVSRAKALINLQAPPHAGQSAFIPPPTARYPSGLALFGPARRLIPLRRTCFLPLTRPNCAGEFLS